MNTKILSLIVIGLFIYITFIYLLWFNIYKATPIIIHNTTPAQPREKHNSKINIITHPIGPQQNIRKNKTNATKYIL